MKVLSEGGHLRIDHRLVRVRVLLVLSSESESASESAVLLVWSHVLLLLLHLLSHQAVLVVVGDPDLGADDHHHVGDDLAVVNHHRLDCSIQHPNFEEAHLLAVLQHILQRGKVNIEERFLPPHDQMCLQNQCGNYPSSPQRCVGGGLKLSVPEGILSDTWLGILSEDPACNGESGREYINNKLE